MLVDASNLLHRSYHASIAAAKNDSMRIGQEIMPLQTRDGFPTGALVNWFRTLLKLQEDYQPEMLVTVFDHGRPKERMDVLPDYKANRGPRDESLVTQMDDAYANTALFGFPVVRKDNTEADDILAVLSRKWDGDRVIIVGDDKDLGQCVNSKVFQLKSPRVRGQGWALCGEVEIEERFGVKPTQVADFLAMTGDSSDNIPGLPGVGPGYAKKWLSAHGDIEGVIENRATLAPERFRAVVEDNQEKLRSYLTVTRALDVDVEIPPAIPRDSEKMFEYLARREMKSIAARIESLDGRPAGAPAPPLPGRVASAQPLSQSPTQGMLF